MENAVIPFLDTLKLVGTLGLPTVLVVVFVWWTWIRETRLSDRVTSLEKFIHDRLLDLIQQSTESHLRVHSEVSDLCKAVKAQTMEIAKLCESSSALKTRLDSNPCLLRTDKKKIFEALKIHDDQ